MKTIREKIFFDASNYFDAMMADLKKATRTIEIEAYIFNLDELGKRIMNILQQCSECGIKVRLLVDGAGTPKWGGSAIRKLEKTGGETRIFHPFPWRLWQWSRSVVHVPAILKAIYLLLKINSRNHRKTCIIDDEIVYTGSFNIDVRHLGKENAGDGWHDAGVRLQIADSKDIKDIKQAFESAWNHTPIQERLGQIFRQVKRNPVIRLNNTRHRRRIFYKNLLKRIKICERRIWITNAYFVPDNRLLKSLNDAAKSGIDVKILLPKKSDVLFMPWATSTFYENLVKSGVRIYEYLPSVLHAKTLILDDWICIGSSNLNHRSLLHDLEVDVCIRRTGSKRLIEKQFLQDIQNSREINRDNVSTRSIYQRLIGHLLLYIKYII